MAQFANCMKIIAVRFENHSIHINTAGVYKSWSTLLCTVANNNCGRLLTMEHLSYWYSDGENFDVPYTSM